MIFILVGSLIKDTDKLKLMLQLWSYNIQHAQAAQAQAQAQAQAATAALSPNTSLTTTAVASVGNTPVTSQSAISTTNNTMNNSTLTGKYILKIKFRYDPDSDLP